MEDNFSFKWEVGNGLGMIQGHYIYCALYFSSYYISSTSDHQTLDPGGWSPLPYTRRRAKLVVSGGIYNVNVDAEVEQSCHHGLLKWGLEELHQRAVTFKNVFLAANRPRTFQTDFPVLAQR